MTEPITSLQRLPARKRGGQVGNRNAVTHGFYARHYTPSDKKDLETYTFIGLKDEIAALRLLNRRAIDQALAAEDPFGFQEAARIVIGLTAALNATLRTQLELGARGDSQFDLALNQALEDIHKELGEKK